jgi:hypothetical protein
MDMQSPPVDMDPPRPPTVKYGGPAPKPMPPTRPEPVMRPARRPARRPSPAAMKYGGPRRTKYGGPMRVNRLKYGGVRPGRKYGGRP